MTRIVGTQNRSEFILDPVQAWHRGRALDQMLGGARLPVQHGVRRATHRVFNEIDDVRQLEQARLINSPDKDLARLLPSSRMPCSICFNRALPMCWLAATRCGSTALTEPLKTSTFSCRLVRNLTLSGSLHRHLHCHMVTQRLAGEPQEAIYM